MLIVRIYILKSFIDKLKRRINSKRAALSHAVFKRSDGSWRCRLRACVRAGNRHFEHDDVM